MEHREKRPRLNAGVRRPDSKSDASTSTRPTPNTSTNAMNSTPIVHSVSISTYIPTGSPTYPPRNPPMTRNLDKSTWQGWAEIENDPMVFNIMLREWGVRGVCVNEVVPLDAVYDSSPTSTLGLIFLSRYRPGGKKQRDRGGGDEDRDRMEESKGDLWFANQISTFSCATVALMNIIGNVPAEKIKLGPELSRFLTSTGIMSSKDKGLALNSFEHVRRVHNSFATLIDMQSVDQRLREDAKSYHHRRVKRKKQQHKRKPQAKSNSKPKSKSRSYLKSKHTSAGPSNTDNDDDDDDDDDDDEDEQGYHFTAYIPSRDQTQLWRMDGLERHPEPLGRLSGDSSSSSSSNWLTMAVTELSNQLARGHGSVKGGSDEMEFSVLSLVAQPTEKEEEAEMERSQSFEAERMREDWGPALAEVVRLVAERGLGGQGREEGGWVG